MGSYISHANSHLYMYIHIIFKSVKLEKGIKAYDTWSLTLEGRVF